MSSLETDWMDAEETSQESVAPKKLPIAIKQKSVVKRKPRKASRTHRPKDLILAERDLSLEHRYYIRMIAESHTFGEAERRMTSAGWPKHDRATYWRWRQEPDFAEALALTQDWQYKCANITKAQLMLDAQKVKELALTPTPILYKGDAAGYRDEDGIFHEYTEVELGVALRAIEFQGKGLGITDPDQRGVTVNIDIDFSGRVDGIDAVPIEGEFEETMVVD